MNGLYVFNRSDEQTVNYSLHYCLDTIFVKYYAMRSKMLKLSQLSKKNELKSYG